jgi:tetratricopeptide (TPR) repeat protein
MELINEVGRLIREGKPLEALERIKEEAPEDVKEVVKEIFRKPEEVKKLEGIWRALVSLSYFSYVSMFTSERNDNQSLTSCVVSSTNAVKLSSELGMDYLIPRFLRNAARALIMMDMKDRAEKFYLEAERIAESISDEKELAEVENDLATLLYDLGRYEEAVEKIEKAIKIRERLGDREDFAESLVNAGEIYKKIGEFEIAEDCFREAEKIYRELLEKDKSMVFNLAITLSNYSMLHKMKGRYEEAERLLNESLELMQDLEKKDRDFAQFVATTLKHLGDLHREMKNYERAREYYEKSREKFRDIQARWESFAG